MEPNEDNAELVEIDTMQKFEQLCLFANLVEDDFFAKSGTKSMLKLMAIRLVAQSKTLQEKIKNYVQAKIPNHRVVMQIWAMIEPALEAAEEHRVSMASEPPVPPQKM